MSLKWTEEEIREAFMNENYVITRIVGKKDPRVHFHCHCCPANRRFVQDIVWSKFKKGKRCTRCTYLKRREKHRKTYEQILEEFEGSIFKLTEKKEDFIHYKTLFHSYRCRCPKGHEIRISPIDIRYNHAYCPRCNKNRKQKGSLVLGGNSY